MTSLTKQQKSILSALDVITTLMFIGHIALGLDSHQAFAGGGGQWGHG